MSEQTIEPQAQLQTEVDFSPPSATAQDIIKPLEETTYEFDFWEDLKASLPPWVNEVVGFALIVFGILSFISLYIASDALVAVTWADMLTSLFGDGALFVAGAIFAFGVLLWLPKAGLRIGVSATRMLALELIFLSFLAILHLSNSDSELRALARAGQGGGLIGWGLSYPVYWMLGRPASVVFFGAITCVSVVILIGVRRGHLASFFSRLGIRLQALSEYKTRSHAKSLQEEAQDLYKQLALAPAYRTGLMRIRANPTAAPAPSAAADPPDEPKPAAAFVRAAPSAPAETTPSAHDEPGVDSSEGPSADEDFAQAQSAASDRPPEEAVGDARATPRPAPLNAWSGSLPALDQLTAAAMRLPSDDEIEHKARLIQHTLLEFDLETTVLDVQVGPTVTRFALLPHKEDGSDRIRMSKIASYARDLSLALAAKRLRMETPVPGANFMGIEVPNKEPATVALRNVLESEAYQQQQSRNRAGLMIPLGRDVAGAPVAVDLAQMPHLLIAGATGSGKSVCLAAITTSLLMQYTPDQLRLVMLDPKMVELTRFGGIPHLIGPVETEHDRISGVLRWCTAEMARRYELLEAHKVRNIKAYNEAQQELGAAAEPLPYLLMLIDEIGDLMLTNPDGTEHALTRLAQMARAVGMHMIIATQRPSVDVITGLVKANFPARIAFSVASAADSRVILDHSGAEDLLGRGDMLFLSADASAPQRIQGCFVSESDVRAIVSHWRDSAAPQPQGESSPASAAVPWENNLDRAAFLAATDPMLDDVLKLIVASGEASASLIQRRLALGYPRAARIMDLLAELGLIGEELGGGRSREVIIPRDRDPLDFAMERFKAGAADA